MTTGADGRIVFSKFDGKDLLEVKSLENPSGWVWSAKGMKDDKIVSCSSDGFVRIWDLKEGKMKSEFRGDSRALTALVYI